ncbi:MULTISPECIES: NTP transferase domain-containing protein [Emticicia]|uniref:NTP transferase domain-containing protein n=1 Tax=Emticicia TaxID=312278 RepID=UPI0009EF6D60|nr:MULTISPECIES: NTP transferase domain-containing protein [Emticicia]
MKGLILIGGRSSRMGTDKGLLEYHGKPQREYLLELAKKYCSEVYYSCRVEQVFSQNTIIDEYQLGPMGGILSAFEKDSQTAWLVMACDMPFLNQKSFELLINHRNPNKIATAFFNPATNAPDPLFTIYEPQAYPLLIAYTQTGAQSPKNFLLNNSITTIHLPDSTFLTNANTPEEFKQVKNHLTKE